MGRQGFLYLDELFLGFVSTARPKEPLETISTPAGHNMYVKVRHALAYPVVDSHKCPLCLHYRLYRSRQELCFNKNAAHKILGKIEHGFIMRFRD